MSLTVAGQTKSGVLNGVVSQCSESPRSASIQSPGSPPLEPDEWLSERARVCVYPQACTVCADVSCLPNRQDLRAVFTKGNASRARQYACDIYIQLKLKVNSISTTIPIKKCIYLLFIFWCSHNSGPQCLLF